MINCKRKERKGNFKKKQYVYLYDIMDIFSGKHYVFTSVKLYDIGYGFNGMEIVSRYIKSSMEVE